MERKNLIPKIQPIIDQLWAVVMLRNSFPHLKNPQEKPLYIMLVATINQLYQYKYNELQKNN